MLLFGLQIDMSGASPEEAKEVAQALTQARAEMRQQQIDALESLQDLFEEAFAAAAIKIKDGAIPVQSLKVTDYLEDDEPNPEDN